MVRILIGGAGGAPSEGVIHSLKKNPNFEVIGIGADSSDLVNSMAKLKRLVPYAAEKNYFEELRRAIIDLKPNFLHFQNDSEIFVISKLRELFDHNDVKYFLPSHDVVNTCVHKYLSYLAFVKSGLKVPRNILIRNEKDLKYSFKTLSNMDGKIWLRSSKIGGGGKGSVATNNFDFAKSWIQENKGWGTFLGAQMLTNKTVTWQSLWREGQLIVAQTRVRQGWIHGDRTISGVTGVTKVGMTFSDTTVDEIAIKAIKAVDLKPNGLYGVDMAYDDEGIPNPTEINIGRFFTTIRFFTEAGLNMPELYVQIAMGIKPTLPQKKINPLPNGLLWIRGMDREPKLMHADEFENFVMNSK